MKGAAAFLRAAQRLEVVGARDVVGQARLDADDNVTMARDRALRQSHAGGIDVVRLAGRSDDAGPRDVDQAAAELRRAARDRGNRVHIVRSARAGIDPGGDAVLQTHRRALLTAPGMGVDVDQARNDNLAARIDVLGGIRRDAGLDRRNPAASDRHIADRIQSDRGVDDA